MSRYLAKAEEVLETPRDQTANITASARRVQANIAIARGYAAMAAIDRGLPPGG